MKKVFFILFLLSAFLLTSGEKAQTKRNNTVEGRVLEYETGKPLENVNIYISGTTWGTTTDQAGNFEIRNIPSGIQQIVASIIGYESRTKSVHLSNGKTYNLTFQLPVAHYELKAVTVSGEVPEAWKRNYQLFEKWFLGSSEFASNCVIENPEVINFTWTNKSHLTSQAEGPLKIINNDLGYEINCVMVSFDLDPEDYHIKTTIRPSFTEMNDTTGFLTEKWKNNRKIAYEGSIDNFLQAIKENKIQQNGFQVYQDIGPLSEVPLSRLKHIKDLLTKSNNGQYSLTFNGYLRILYISKDPDNPEVSWIKLLYPAVTLDSYGYSVEPVPFKVYGYWTKFGVADMLPKYYASKDSL